MKKPAILYAVVFFLGGCGAADINIEPKEQQTEAVESGIPQERQAEFDQEQSQKRVNEMLVLQKQIQDINAEISLLIEYHHNQIDTLIDEREFLSKKLNELYNQEKEYQGLK